MHPPRRSRASLHLSHLRLHIPGAAAQQRLALLVAEHIPWRAVVLQPNAGRGPEFYKNLGKEWEKHGETWEKNMGKKHGQRPEKTWERTLEAYG